MKKIFKFKQTYTQQLDVEARSEKEAREKLASGQYVKHRPKVLSTSLESDDPHGIELHISTRKPCCPICSTEINLKLAELMHKDAGNEICHKCESTYAWEKLDEYRVYYSMELKGDEQD